MRTMICLDEAGLEYETEVDGLKPLVYFVVDVGEDEVERANTALANACFELHLYPISEPIRVQLLEAGQ